MLAPARAARKPRALDDVENVTVWNAAKGRGSFGNLVRLLLLTGARRGEIAKFTHDSILKDRIVLPPLPTKTGVKHEVPLTQMMRVVIAAQPVTTSKLAFPSERTGGVLDGWGRTVAALQRAPGGNFTLHDLRHTVRTLMSRHRVEFDIAELAIGYMRKGLDPIYNFDKARKLRCNAFAKVPKHIAKLLAAPAASKQPIVFPADWKDVTAERIGKTVGIVGSTSEER